MQCEISFFLLNFSSNLFFQAVKELQNHIRKLFCVHHKNRRKHNQHFQLFFKLNSDLDPTNEIPTCQEIKIKCISHKQYLFGRLLPIKQKKTRTDQSTFQVF